MKIGKLARRTGLTASAIRYYENVGLLLAPQRSGGQRRFPPDALHRVLLIRYANEMSFTLAEIKLTLSGVRDSSPVGVRWKKLAHRKIKDVNRTIASSQRLKSLLEHLLRCNCLSLQICVQRLSLSENLKHIRGHRAARPFQPRTA